MRRLFLAATCAAVLLCAAPAALALDAPLHGHKAAGSAVHAAAVKELLTRAPAAFVPLARRIPTGNGVINLNVYTYEGLPEVGAKVKWVVDEGAYGWAPGPEADPWRLTDEMGHVTFTNVPAGNGPNLVNAEIVVRTAGAPDDYYHLDKMSWPPEGFTADLRPGRLPLTITRTDDSEWGSWPSVKTMLWTVNTGGETHIARTTVAGTVGTTVEGFANTMTLGTETLAGGSLYFWQDQGISLPVAGSTVSPGTEAPRQVVDQAQAQRVWMKGWGSGKPGSRSRIFLDKYPAGWVNAIQGQADYPKSAPVASFGKLTTTGSGDGASVTIPSSVLPGYKYYVWADRNDGWFGLVTWFQTCTLKPSKTAVARGRTVALSGVVPVANHLGTTAGTPKTVTIYRTTSSKVAAKGQPSVRGGGTVAGWTKIATMRTDGLGKYRKGSIKVSRTAWYCAWYPHDSWYWGAWTSLTKVTAR